MANVLVVEDNPSNMKLTRYLLEQAGHHVLESGDASLAIQIARTHVPDLILMDVQLPGVDGLTATRMLKADPDLRHVPVVALTALAMRGDEQRILAAGCDGYIAKPIEYRQFLARIEELVGRVQ
jgi:two-component system, cell cycle response regulator DivK